jgi:RNA polymerase sigma-70 factor (ECF subfamily)
VSGSPEERLMTALYQEHGPVLLAFARRYVDRSQAEDVVQETLLRAWRHLDRLDTDRGNPRAYLMTVTRNVLTDQWRARRSRPQLVDDDDPLDRIPTDDDIDAALERSIVSEALTRLTPEHRAVVQSLYFDGRTIQETAARLHLPPGTVKSRSYYAIRALRTVFEEMGVIQ